MGKKRNSVGQKYLTPVSDGLHADGCEPSTSGRHGDYYTAGEQRYLCYFLHRYLDFRVPEVNALACMVGCSSDSIKWEKPFGGEWMSPFWYITLPNPAAAFEIVKRSVLVRGLYEVWGEGSSWEELQASIEACPDERKAPFFDPEATFRVHIDTWGFKFSPEEQKAVFEKLAFLPFQGKVRLKDAQHIFWFIAVDKLANNGMPEVPPRMYFVRQVALSNRRTFSDYALPKRRYLGPTSMDPEMAFIMCNQAHVRRGTLVMDPYVGTGSILVAAAQRGAYVLGADIDPRVIREGKLDKATGQRYDIYSNFEQYGLPWPVGLVRMDVHRPPFRPGLEEVLDAVVGDPPYGVRAGGRKSVAKDIVVKDRTTHITSTDPYTMSECLIDLLDMAARLLKVGGRLVYFMPATPETYRPEELPQHPVLQLVENTEQPLTSRYSRRLITMEKTARCDAAAAADFERFKASFSMAIDQVPNIVYEQGTRQGQAQASKSGQQAGDDKQQFRRRFRGKMC